VDCKVNADHHTPNWAWQDFWKADRLNSCVPHSSRAAVDIAAYWERIFENLTDRSRILDVATGNGAVLAYAGAVARRSGKAFEMTGVDLADIDPHRFVSDREGLLTGVRFMGCIAAERLPFESGMFDCVVSQYGLEYADLKRALWEAGRVLRPGGRLHWLAHTRDSEVVKQSQSKIADVDALLHKAGPLVAMQTFIAGLESNANSKLTWTAAVQAVQSARSSAKSQSNDVNIVEEVCRGLATVLSRPRAYRTVDLKNMLDESATRLAQYRGRIEALIDGALTAAREQEVGRCLVEPLWVNTEIRPIRAGQSGSLIGIAVSADRSNVDTSKNGDFAGWGA